jgi:hypothetical protein
MTHFCETSPVAAWPFPERCSVCWRATVPSAMPRPLPCATVQVCGSWTRTRRRGATGTRGGYLRSRRSPSAPKPAPMRPFWASPPTRTRLSDGRVVIGDRSGSELLSGRNPAARLYLPLPSPAWTVVDQLSISLNLASANQFLAIVHVHDAWVHGHLASVHVLEAMVQRALAFQHDPDGSLQTNQTSMASRVPSRHCARAVLS